MLMHTGRSGLTPLRRGGYLNGTLAGALIDLSDSSDPFDLSDGVSKKTPKGFHGLLTQASP